MKNQTFRSKVGWVFGWAWIVFAAWNTWDLIAHGSMPSALIAGAVLGVITLVVFLLALRPAIVAEQGGVRVRNPLRNAYVPWNAVGDVHVTHSIIIEAGHTTIRCWTPQATARERARATARAGRTAKTQQTMTPGERAAAEAVAGRTHADFVAQQLSDMSQTRSGDSTGETAVTWSPSALAAVAATVVLVVVTVILA
ncbi:hypothetical protein Pth03_15840 [Planotetraspora thailandica]|uniref:Low molecular weight protein antigen 6 PH domain-containing protein n=1 Tax=Planotetraspora thailandica TaxID=487172 RepID=A0A8J3XUK5_9ACTN|nr:PH domain-containing protein [Planotetraspora thailandica]GII53195.1 hypothetical protein Pth03_15840 [Planotetraspora thailandica]